MQWLYCLEARNVFAPRIILSPGRNLAQRDLFCERPSLLYATLFRNGAIKNSPPSPSGISVREWMNVSNLHKTTPSRAFVSSWGTLGSYLFSVSCRPRRLSYCVVSYALREKDMGRKREIEKKEICVGARCFMQQWIHKDTFWRIH